MPTSSSDILIGAASMLPDRAEMPAAFTASPRCSSKVLGESLSCTEASDERREDGERGCGADEGWKAEAAAKRLNMNLLSL